MKHRHPLISRPDSKWESHPFCLHELSNSNHHVWSISSTHAFCVIKYQEPRLALRITVFVVEFLVFVLLVALHSTVLLYRTWDDRSSTFAIYLFLVEIFPSTLLSTSIYGFCVTRSGVSFSGSIGSVIDRSHRLRILQVATFGQKLCLLPVFSSYLSGRRDRGPS